MENSQTNQMVPNLNQPIEEEKIEALYDIGKQLYENKKHTEAESIFRMLCIINAAQPKYVRAFAANQQAQGKYESASEYYLAASIMDEPDLRNYYNMAQCMVLIGEPTAAIGILEILLKYAADKTTEVKHENYVLMAETFIQNLKETHTETES